MELMLPSRGSRQPEQLSGYLPSKDREVLSLIRSLISPMISLAEGGLADRLPEHLGLNGCRQFLEPGARCSSEGAGR